MQRRRQRCASVPPLRRSDQPKRRIGREALRVVEVFAAGQAAVDRLPQEIRQRELGVLSVAGVTQVRGDDRLQPEAFIQLTDQNQAGVRGDARSLKRDLQKAVEGELKRLGFFVTHRVSPFVEAFLACAPRETKARCLFCGGEYHDQIGNPGL
jgi:hypothetical protein